MKGIWVAVKATTSVAGSSRYTTLKLWKSLPAAPMMSTRLVISSLSPSRQCGLRAEQGGAYGRSPGASKMGARRERGAPPGWPRAGMIEANVEAKIPLLELLPNQRAKAQGTTGRNPRRTATSSPEAIATPLVLAVTFAGGSV